ncbi:hypothetical protein GALMADRAFT_249994 [Galerina marginata CBS 339.88]|uniref:AB hydrolase-1 domain-containing protein n=1 Tax=Galerina marginata (strain CBS 339.88) TaxID=685588 RepID=A0A067STL7_GALM3|nr:hypothetical protein GALMADRAFT_249994 [Galerina marginata CBS 339.88]
MLVESYKLPPSSNYPLFITAKRYWVHEFEKNIPDPSAKTLIVLHSTSFHKETWEPALEDLFKSASRAGSKFVIREAWAIDCPNHGESGHMNHRALKKPEFASFSCEKYAQAVHRFLSAGPDHGACVDFRSRNLIGIGHSLGANALLMLYRIQPTFTFLTLVIVEPLVSPEGPHHLAPLRKRLVDRATNRRELWPNLDVVRKAFTQPNRTPLRWEHRVLDSFLTYALHKGPEADVYSLCCTVNQEVSMYLDTEGSIKPVEDLDRICHSVPIHLILGEKPDFIPKHVHDALLDPSSGRRFASLKIIKDVGHLIPQEIPTDLASYIFEVLSSNSPPIPPSRL